jgi:hypothetical protein
MTHLYDCPLDDEPVSPSFHPAELASPPHSDDISEGDINKSNTQPTTNVSPAANTAPTGSSTNADAVAPFTAPQPPAAPAPTTAADHMALLRTFFTSEDFKNIIGNQVQQHLDKNKQEPTTPITTATTTTTGNSTFTTQQSKPTFASVTGNNQPTPPPGNIWTTTTPATATTAFPPLPSPTAPSTKRLHPKGSPISNPPPPGFTRLSSNQHPPSNTPPLQTAISELGTTTSSNIHVNREHYRTISAVHPNSSNKIGDTIASSINQVLLHHSPSMASTIKCISIKRSANASDNPNHMQCVVEFDMIGNHSPTDTAVYEAHCFIFHLFQSIQASTRQYSTDNIDSDLTHYWMNQGLPPILAACTFDSFPTFLQSNKFVNTSIFLDWLPSWMANSDILGFHHLTLGVLQSLAPLDTTGLLHEVLKNPALVLHNLTIRVFTPPTPKPSYNKKSRKASPRKPAPTLPKALTQVLSFSTSDNTFGRLLANIITNITWDKTSNEFTLLDTPFSSQPTRIRPMPSPDNVYDVCVSTNESWNKIRNNINVSVVTGLPANLWTDPTAVQAIHDDDDNILGMFPNFKTSDVSTSSARIVNLRTLDAAFQDNSTIIDRANTIMDITTLRSTPELDSNPSYMEPTTSPQAPPTTLYDANGITLYSSSKHTTYYVKVFGAGGSYIEISTKYSDIQQVTHGIPHNHHFSRASKDAILSSLSNIFCKPFTSFEDIQKHNDTVPLDATNFSLELLPIQLDFVSKRSKTKRQTPANTHRALPTSDEELLRRYANTSPEGRLQFCLDPNNTALLPNYVQMAITFIDHEEHQPPTREWLDSLLTKVSRNALFTYSEYTTLNTTVRETYKTPPATPPSPQNEVVDLTGMNLHNNASAEDDDSLEIQDDEMSTSEIVVDSQDTSAIYRPTTSMDCDDKSNKRKHEAVDEDSIATQEPPRQQSLADLLHPERISQEFYLYHSIPPFMSVNDLHRQLLTEDFVPPDDMLAENSVREHVKAIHLCQVGDVAHLASTSEIPPNIPTHALWVCATEYAFTTLRDAIYNQGILNHPVYDCNRLQVDDTIKLLPLDTAMENASAFAHHCKLNCPANQEFQLYALIKLKDDHRLGPWLSQLHGKSDHSL